MPNEEEGKESKIEEESEEEKDDATFGGLDPDILEDDEVDIDEEEI